MNLVLTIIGIIVFGFIVNVILKQTYNFIFFLGKKPYLWIGSVVVVSLIVWGLSAIVEWSVSIPAWSCIIALVMNWPPGQNTKEEAEAVRTISDEVYAEMGIRYGRLLHRLGLVAFAITCIGFWIIFYGEVCADGECTKIINNIFQ